MFLSYLVAEISLFEVAITKPLNILKKVTYVIVSTYMASMYVCIFVCMACTDGCACVCMYGYMYIYVYVCMYKCITLGGAQCNNAPNPHCWFLR